MKKVKFGLVVMAAITLVSCHTYKNIAYFRDIPDSARISLQNAHFKALQIQKGDFLNVNIQVIDPGANAIFNQAQSSSVSQLGGMSAGGGSGMTIGIPSPSTTAFPGYLVDEMGCVQLPLIGKVHVEGMSTALASDTIEGRISQFYKSPSVAVHFANLRISVMGEVNRPGAYIMANERNTIFDALSIAGDLTIFGKRENILLIRDSAGYSNFIRFNLNNKDLVQKDYYFLRQNDVLYIEPNKGKAANVDAASVRTYAIITSVLTLLVVIASRL